MNERDKEQAIASLRARLKVADELRGAITRKVGFGVNDDDLPEVLALCDRLEKQSLERAGRELASIVPDPMDEEAVKRLLRKMREPLLEPRP